MYLTVRIYGQQLSLRVEQVNRQSRLRSASHSRQTVLFLLKFEGQASPTLPLSYALASNLSNVKTILQEVFIIYWRTSDLSLQHGNHHRRQSHRQ